MEETEKKELDNYRRAEIARLQSLGDYDCVDEAIERLEAMSYEQLALCLIANCASEPEADDGDI